MLCAATHCDRATSVPSCVCRVVLSAMLLRSHTPRAMMLRAATRCERATSVPSCVCRGAERDDAALSHAARDDAARCDTLRESD